MDKVKKNVVIISDDALFVERMATLMPSRLDVQLEVFGFFQAIRRESNSPAIPIVILDIVRDEKSVASSKIESMLSAELAGPLLVIGSCPSGNCVARWSHLGITDFLDWPIEVSLFQSAFEFAESVCELWLELRMEYSSLCDMSQSITPPEREVMEMVLQGVPNKSIANRLSVSQRTVESRRQKIYRKMSSAHLAELVRTMDRIQWLRHELEHPNHLVSFCLQKQRSSAIRRAI